MASSGGSTGLGPSLVRFGLLSVAAALLAMGLKAAGYLLTGSIGLLSDALESVVNLAASTIALGALIVAARPADESHPHGHGKVEHVAAAIEGAMIIVAALAIVVASVDRLIRPRELEQLGVGLALMAAAALVNLAVGTVLVRAGRQHRSVALEGDGHHLLADVWTTVGVVGGLATVALTGWERLDPIVALGVSVHIGLTGLRVLRTGVDGLMDASLSDEDRTTVEAIFERVTGPEVTYHALRTRRSGRARFVSAHLLVPGRWTVQRSHDLTEALEAEVAAALPGASLLVHVEPIEDPASYDDELDDLEGPARP